MQIYLLVPIQGKYHKCLDLKEIIRDAASVSTFTNFSRFFNFGSWERTSCSKLPSDEIKVLPEINGMINGPVIIPSL